VGQKDKPKFTGGKAALRTLMKLKPDDIALNTTRLKPVLALLDLSSP